MIKVNVRTVNYPLPKGERLIFEDAQLNSEDFSGKTLRRLGFSNCQLKLCKFENMKVESVGFGGGLTQTVFTDCSFDRSRFKGPAAGNVKFVRCSFREIDFYDFFFFKGEFIDCVFSGKMRKIVFYHRILPGDRYEGLREANEFHGNDFSQAFFKDVSFHGGIDLTKQKLPVNEKYMYVANAYNFIDALKEKSNYVTHEKIKSYMLTWIKIYEDQLKHGQTQLFVMLDELVNDVTLIKEISTIFKDAANESQNFKFRKIAGANE